MWGGGSLFRSPHTTRATLYQHRQLRSARYGKPDAPSVMTSRRRLTGLPPATTRASTIAVVGKYTATILSSSSSLGLFRAQRTSILPSSFSRTTATIGIVPTRSGLSGYLSLQASRKDRASAELSSSIRHLVLPPRRWRTRKLSPLAIEPAFGTEASQTCLSPCIGAPHVLSGLAPERKESYRIFTSYLLFWQGLSITNEADFDRRLIHSFICFRLAEWEGVVYNVY